MSEGIRNATINASRASPVPKDEAITSMEPREAALTMVLSAPIFRATRAILVLREFVDGCLRFRTAWRMSFNVEPIIDTPSVRVASWRQMRLSQYPSMVPYDGSSVDIIKDADTQGDVARSR